MIQGQNGSDIWNCEKCGDYYLRNPENSDTGCTRDDNGNCDWFESEQDCFTCLLENPTIDSSLTNECNAALTFTESCDAEGNSIFSTQFYPRCDVGFIGDQDLIDASMPDFALVQGPLTTGDSRVWYAITSEKMSQVDGENYRALEKL